MQEEPIRYLLFIFFTLNCAGQSVTTDIYLPTFKLAIEYQGEHHYKQTGNTTTPCHDTSIKQ